MFYTVGEMAKKAGITASALRYYDKEGLLPPIERTSGGIRMFREEDVEWLHLIECLKKTGMSLKEIKMFVDWVKEGDSTIQSRLALIDRQRQAVIGQIEKLNQTLDMLEYRHWYYSVAAKAGTCAASETLPDSEIPENIRKIKRRINKD